MVRVLIVDDEVQLRTALARGLTAEGFEVKTATDGPTALPAAPSDRFDVIVLDIIIPSLTREGVGRTAVAPEQPARRPCGPGGAHPG